MPTASSSTEGHPAGRWAEVCRAVADVGPLLRFRAHSARGTARATAVAGLVAMVVATLAAGWLPAYLPEGDDRRTDVQLLLPSLMAGVLLVAVVAAAASGGGRELLAREHAVAFPVGPVTDHLGTLVMAPLNLTWMLQAWMLVGSVAYVVGARPGLVLSQAIAVAWLVAATSLAHLAGWGVEWLRRRTHGVLAVRSLGVLVTAVGAALVVTDRLVPMLDASPTLSLTVAALQAASGPTPLWYGVLAALCCLSAVAVAAGASVCSAAARRPPRDESALETSPRPASPDPLSDFAAVLRLDRAGVWRSVPLRRGILVLALLPGLVALAGDLPWEMVAVLPGLVASGGALLFGVNCWCLDGRGALWRESLPVSPLLTFGARAVVLAEVLLAATALTLLLAALRAGLPSPSELSAVTCAAVVVVAQVVAACVRWSVRRPFAADLRSARATPAPPLVMVGYSARLALTTTLTGLLFAVASRASWEWPPLVAVPLLLLAASRMAGAARAFADPVTRSRVVATVAS